MVHKPSKRLDWIFRLPKFGLSGEFTNSRKAKKHPYDLYSIRQRELELLRSFVSPFNKENVLIPGCTFSTTISAFQKGLRPNSDIYKEFTKDLFRTMEDLFNKAQAQIKWEEDEAN